MIDYGLTSSEQYFSYIQDENKFDNISKLYRSYIIEMREGWGQPSSRLLTATEKVGGAW